MENPIKDLHIKYDGDLAIATGRSAHEINWKNRQISWSALLQKLKEPRITGETPDEYRKMSKEEQGNKKDVGGFVGGALKQGRRKVENVANRTLITLDMDEVIVPAGEVWSDITTFNDFAATIYSTHSHTEDHPRLRLVIPLSRPVTPDEYQAISRMLASDLGIDQFDDTTYDTNRLMYWPSISQGAPYFFRVQDGPWLDPQAILDRYLDWTDTSYWPQSSRQNVRINTLLKKQEDPLAKKGVIGAFCRAYSIGEAISKFLPDIYTPGKTEDRYTYSGGSTSGGVVVYDDKYTFSHHGTDPTSGILCNAFDLVRIHKFTELDEKAKLDTPVNKLPSFKKMQEFASDDPGVKKEIARESLASVDEDFDFDIAEVNDENWVEDLTYIKGELASTIANAITILSNDPRVKGRFGKNLFTQRTMVLDKLPWSDEVNRDWNDTDDSGLRDFMEKYWKFTSPGKLLDAMNLVFEANSFHPVRDYLNGLTWDGTERLEDVLIDYLGAEDIPYTKAVCKLHLVAAVARVFRPGCKYDYMLTLTGKQGLGKSTLIRYLAGDQYFNDSITELKGKDTMEALQGSWLIELGEMSATKKADVETVKQFVAKTSDRYRPPYGRRTVDYPRQSIFWGTTNDIEFLRDKTGNRRFFPVDVGAQPCIKDVFEDLPAERDQIWAEAVEIYKSGFRLYLDEEMAEEAIRQQEAHAEESSKFGMVEEYLKRRLPMDWYTRTLVERKAFINKELDQDFDEPFEDTMPRDKVCVMEIWCELLNGDPKALSPINAREINDIMRVMPGWEKAKSGLRFGDVYGQQRAYIRAERLLVHLGTKVGTER